MEDSIKQLDGYAYVGLIMLIIMAIGLTSGPSKYMYTV